MNLLSKICPTMDALGKYNCRVIIILLYMNLGPALAEVDAKQLIML